MHRHYNFVRFFKYKLFQETLKIRELGAGLTRCGAWGSVVVRALRYKSVGPGIDSKR